jgi:histone arginine demethylase JMJD6
VTDVIPEAKRPPYQWLLIGPSRAGTRMHTDPRNTSAFNLSVVGRKHWVLMHPGVPRDVAKGHVVMTKEEKELLAERGNPPASYWFRNILPRLRVWVAEREARRQRILAGQSADAMQDGSSTASADGNMNAHKVTAMGPRVTATADFGLVEDEAAFAAERALKPSPNSSWDELRDGYGWSECIQYPHDVIFVPGQWWHAVLNIGPATIAVTQNQTTQCNFPSVYRNMRRHNKRTTRRWLRALRREDPQWSTLAAKIDAHDGIHLSKWQGNEENSDTDRDVDVSESESSSCPEDLFDDDDEMEA